MANAPKMQVVESDGKAALSMAAAFRQRGWDVVSASDATTAMSVAVQSRPDAVVLNMDVPGGGGIAVLKRMRASVHTAITPVIAIGRNPELRARDFLSAGAQDCLSSAANADALCLAVEKHLKRPMPVVGAPKRSCAPPPAWPHSRRPDSWTRTPRSHMTASLNSPPSCSACRSHC